MFDDLSDLDEIYASSLKGMYAMEDDELDYLCLDFTTAEEMMGRKELVELIPGGKGTALAASNLPEYVEACLKYRLMGRYEDQLTSLLLGFYDVIPEPLLAVFDFQEIELLMCGLPEIKVRDWMAHTEYTGECEARGPSHQVCVWFWEVVMGYDEEMKARLLQFATGTSGVPSNGFGFLQGFDGNIRKFTIQGVDLKTCVYPRSQ